MPPKKNKQQKVSLVDFFAETPSSGSWADEIDNIPTAPAKKDPLAGPRRGEQGYLDSMPDRGARTDFSGPPRDEVPVPDVPPFTSFVGNLTFETGEDDLKQFFSAQSPTSVRLVKEPTTGKPKGFGYVEFGSKKDLQDALSLNMTNMAGRTVRVSVAEPPSNPRRDFAPSAAEEASQWRRSGPLPARDAPSMRQRPSFAETSGDRGGDRDRERAPAPERDLDWGNARGARFTPAPPSSDFRRDSSGAGVPRGERDNLRERDSQFSPGVADTADKWRSNKPVAVAAESRPAPAPRAGSGQNSPSLPAPGLADTESTWTRGSKLRTPADTPQSGASPDVSAAPSVGEQSPQTPAAPVERKRLTLAKRSSATATPAASESSSSSIFGSAKPIDTATREAQVEAKRVEERKKQQEEKARKQKEEDAKIQAESDARAKAINDAREQVRKEQGGAGASAGAGAGAGGNRKPPQAPRQYSNSNTNGNGNGPSASRPNKSGRTNSNQAQKTDDGFEVAKGSRRDNRDHQQQSSASNAAAATPATTKKDAPIRQGFSFAAAAGLVDESSESKDEDEKTKGGEEDVTSRLAEVKV